MRRIEDRLARAGLSIASHLFEAYHQDGRPDVPTPAPTVVGILGTLVAEHALAAIELEQRCGLETAAGGWIHGGPADGLLFRNGRKFAGEMASRFAVWDLFGDVVTSEAAVDLEAVVVRAEAHIGELPCPVLSVPASSRPQALVRSAAARHRHATAALAADEGLYTPCELALVHGAAIVTVIRHEPKLSMLAQLAAETMIGAARIRPLPYALS
jgi:hypothetical protein